MCELMRVSRECYGIRLSFSADLTAKATGVIPMAR